MDEPAHYVPCDYSHADLLRLERRVAARLARDLALDPGPTHTAAELADDTVERYTS